MSAFQKILEDEHNEFVNKFTEETSTLDELFNNKLYNIFKYVKTKDSSYLRKETEKLKAEQPAKENVEPNNTITLQEKTKNKTSLLKVKQEKLSLSYSSVSSVASSVISETSTRKNETLNIEIDMPAPSKMPPRKKKIKLEPPEINSAPGRSTRTKSKLLEKSKEIDKGKPSDVIIQDTTMTMIDITDDKDSEKEFTDDEQSKPNKLPIRSTRTKTRQQKKNEEAEQNVKDTVVEPALTYPSPSRVEEEMDGLTEAFQNNTIVIKGKNQNKAGDTENKRKNSADSNDETYQKTNKPPLRTTRTKTRQLKKQEEAAEQVEPEPLKQNKRCRRSSSNDEEVKENTKKPKSLSEDVNSSVQTEYEDAVSDLNPSENQDSTTVVNATITLQESKVAKNLNIPNNVEPVTPPRTTSKKQQIKEIFSPYEKTPLKKKVEAFEKLGSTSKETGSRIPLPKVDGTPGESGRAVKSKANTPFSSKFVPKTCSTSRIDKTHPHKQKNSLYNDSGPSVKSLSALKASQAEFREREKRRQEKEMEAQLKKEALLQAQAEERRRRREEKQLKAQQQRDLLQKEKDKLLENHKKKEEKHKQAIAEKEDKLQKTKEEAEKKRLLAKNKAKLVKEKEEKEAAHNDENNKRERAERTAQKPQENKLPIYMTTRAPLLPTEDCYDSDSDAYQQKVPKPSWARDQQLTKQLFAQLVAGDKIKNTLFICGNKDPDLVEIFENIDPRKLKRTSSAQWKTPPRFTHFPETSYVQFSDDSEY